jgi:hypothetical protein
MMTISTLLFRDIKHIEFNRRWDNKHNAENFNSISHDANDGTIRFPYKIGNTNNLELYKSAVIKYKGFIEQIKLERNEYIEGNILYDYFNIDILDIDNNYKISKMIDQHQKLCITSEWSICICMRQADYDEYITQKNLCTNILKW